MVIDDLERSGLHSGPDLREARVVEQAFVGSSMNESGATMTDMQTLVNELSTSTGMIQ